jgi:hypothetical protein
MFFSFAKLIIFLIFDGLPKVCCTTITFVLLVIFFSNSLISNHSVFLSISEYIIFQELCMTALDTVTQVNHETIISSLFLIHIIFKA